MDLKKIFGPLISYFSIFAYLTANNYAPSDKKKMEKFGSRIQCKHINFEDVQTRLQYQNIIKPTMR